MQFLVYLTVLMVSVSTVLLEVHWLTSPPPQPKAAIRTAAPVPVPKADGPNAKLSPVYPTKVDSPQNEQSASVQSPPAVSSAASGTASRPAPQQAANETTGVAPREEEASAAGPVASQPNSNLNAAPAAQPSRFTPQPGQQPAEQRTQTAANKCDVQACAGAYKSFRADDCTYQPFDGPRRFCAKPPVQRTARDQREERDRSWARDVEPRDSERRVRVRAYDDDEDRAFDMDDDDDGPLFIRRIRRW